MTKINLIAGYQEKKVQTKKVNNYAIVGAVALLVTIVTVIIIIWGINITQKTITSNTNKKINDANKELEQYKELEQTVISLEKGLAGAKEILNGKYQWTKLLTHLEAATPADIQFTKLSLSDGKIEASLAGKNVDSLARFVESYKAYYILELTGAGEPGQDVEITANDQTYMTKVKSSGSWNYAVKFDPTKDQHIVITKKPSDSSSESSTSNVTYTAADQKFVTDPGVSAVPKKLFVNVESKGYTKDQSGFIIFNATIDFDGASIW